MVGMNVICNIVPYCFLNHSLTSVALSSEKYSYNILVPIGLFSCIMRDLSNIDTDHPKWIVLDGDIDPMWIESLNTVMDDNKVG